MRHTMTSKRMPKWLQSMLIEKGVISEAGLGRKAWIKTCRKCSTPTLAGLDADVCAFDAWCDLGELSPAGEAAALLDGRRTYQLFYTNSLSYRHSWHITSRPAGDPQHPVFATHRCGEPIPAVWCVPPTQQAAHLEPEGVLF